MSHVVDLFTDRFGAGGSVMAGMIFIAAALLGIVITLRGRQVMVWLVAFCAAAAGIIGGAAFGLLVFDSFTVMLITAFLGGTALLLLVRFAKSVGYFIGIGVLGFFIAFTVTSELYIDSTRITESTLVFFDLIAGFILGILAAVRSKYIVTVITAAAGGLITSISALALFGVYFADLRMWISAAVITAAGIAVQLRQDENKGRKKK